MDYLTPLPSDTPTEYVIHIDAIEEKRLEIYCRNIREADQSLINWRTASWLETLREIAG